MLQREFKKEKRRNGMNYFKTLICVFLLLFTIMVTTAVAAGAQESSKPKAAEQTKTLSAESVYQLIQLIDTALKDNIPQQIAQLKTKSIQVIDDNKLDTIKKCSSLLDRAIKEELSGKTSSAKTLFQVCRVLGEMYRDAANSSYLLEKVSFLHDFSIESKREYLDAEILFERCNELRQNHKHKEAIDCYNKCMTFYNEIGYKEGQANAILCVGMVNARLSDENKAKYHYKRALLIYRDIKSQLGEANSLKLLGEANRLLDNNDEAQKLFIKAINIYREINDSHGMADSLSRIGDVYRDLNSYKKAIESYEEALAIFCKTKNRRGEAQSHGGLGDYYRTLGDFKKAQSHYEISLIIFREIKDRLEEANSLHRLGDIYRILSDYEMAQKFYTKAIVIYREIKNRLGEANTLRSLGNVYDRLNKYKEAQKFYGRAIVIYRDIGYRYGEAVALFSIGMAYSGVSDYSNALKFYKKTLELCKEIGNRRMEAYSLWGIGDIYRLTDRYSMSMNFYNQALMIFQEIKGRLGEANSLRGLGDVNTIINKCDMARKFYERALVIYRGIGNPLGEANVLWKLGDIHFPLSGYEKSKEFYKKAILIYQRINHPLGEANVSWSLADLHTILANFEDAIKLYNRGLEIYHKINDPLGEAYSLQRLGRIYMSISDYKRARTLFEQALKMYSEIKVLLGKADCFQRLGDVHLYLRDFERARQFNKKGMEIYRDIKNFVGEAISLISLGNINYSMDNLNDAKKCYKEALNLFRQVNYSVGIANSLHHLGSANLKSGDIEASRKQYEQSLKLAKEIGNKNGILNSFFGLGKSFEHLGWYKKAEEYYRNSIQILEEVWGQIKVDELKTRYLSSNISPYAALIDLIFERDKKEEAFCYAERSKARSFLYLLGNRKVDSKKGIPPELVREEEILRQRITAITQNVLQNEEKEKNKRTSTEELKGELLKLKKKHSEIIEKMKLLSPEYASLKTVNPLSVEEIQKLIRNENDTVLIEYYTTEKATYLWSLDGEKIHAYKIDITKKDLDTGVEEFRSFLNEGPSANRKLTSRAKKLYQILLKPVEEHIREKRQIAVVPHGILHYLPFEALMKDEKYLGEQGFKFFYLPSASVYKYCREKNLLKKNHLMAIANPDGTLPHSEKEVKEIRKRFRKNARIFIGNDAKESTIKKNALHPDILHFACHGIFDSDHPMYSGLKLTPDNNDDGRLEVNEIFNLKLKPAYLVTLSACETKMGKMYHGDEIVGISRAFIYAGTPSIVASLWKVDDYYTAKFMAAFYKALKKNDKIDALNIARKRMIKKYGKRHPYYWAAFVLIGDPR